MEETYFNNLKSLAIKYYYLLRESNTKSQLKLPDDTLTGKTHNNIVMNLYPRMLSSVPQEPLFFYAVTKTCFLSLKKTTGKTFLSLALHLLKWAWEIGEYEEVIKISDEFRQTIKVSKENSFEFCRIYKWKAKAMRNLGQYEHAIGAYRDALEIARGFNLSVEVASTILAIGKMYGKYEKQENLYTFFIDKSLILFKNIHKKTNMDEKVSKNVKKGIAICHHELSKYYSRIGKYHDSLKYLEKAITINKKIKNDNGLSRNYCTLALTKHTHDKSISIDEIIKIFKFGYQLLLNNPLQIRGLGIRKIQLGKLLFEKGNKSSTFFIYDGIKIAGLYKDYRTLLRGIYTLAEVAPYNDQIIEKLYEAASLANKLKLVDIEYDINDKLAQILIKTSKSSLMFPVEYVKLYDRNKEIMSELSDKIINNKRLLQKIETKEIESLPEFYNLAKNELSKINFDLIQDYDAIATKLISSYSSLIDVIKENELATQSANLFQMCSQLVHLFYHEIKSIDESSKAKSFMEDMLKLFPNKLGETKLSQCIDYAISLFKKDGIHVEFKKQTDLSLPVPEGFLTFSIIQLIDNGIEAYKKSFIDSNLENQDIISIILDKGLSGDQTIGNPSFNVFFSIVNRAQHNDYKRLERALSDPGFSDKPYRTDKGMGIQYSLFIFETICKAKCQVGEEKGYTYLKFILKPDGLRIKELE